MNSLGYNTSRWALTGLAANSSVLGARPKAQVQVQVHPGAQTITGFAGTITCWAVLHCTEITAMISVLVVGGDSQFPLLYSGPVGDPCLPISSHCW